MKLVVTEWRTENKLKCIELIFIQILSYKNQLNAKANYFYL